MKHLIALFFPLLLALPMLQAQECMEDCVWPGDFNANGVANYLDFLAIGFCYQATGPARTNPSTLWAPQDADDWAGTLPVLGANFKHADADGNGIVDEMDRLVISINYEETNPNFVDFLGHNINGDDLFAVPVDSFVSPGESLFLDIHLGSETNPMTNVYGVGFQLNLDTQYVENVIFDYSNSWLATDDDLLVYDKYSDEQDFLGMAQTRFDGTSVSGFGPIARVEIVITDVILGLQLDSTACLPFPISFENVLGVDENETDKFIATRSDTMGLKHPSQLVSSTAVIEDKNRPFEIFPNPSSGILNIKSPTAFRDLRLYNQMGVLIWREQLDYPTLLHSANLSNLDLPIGLFFLSVGTTESRTVQKLLLE